MWSKLRILGKKCAALLTLLHYSVHLKCISLGRKCSTSASLLFSIVRCISRLKSTFYSRVKCSSVSSFPNFTQENEHLREEAVLSPVDDYFPDSYALGDEFDHEDYDDWEADYLEWGDGYGGYAWDAEGEDEDEEEFWPEDTVDRWDGADEPLDPVEEVVSWTRRAVDEIIAEEEDGEHGTIGQCHGGPIGENGEEERGGMGDLPW